MRAGSARRRACGLVIPSPAMKLGEMLVRDGRLTEAQLAQAVELQQRVGGRFGTVLFEMGVIDLDALTVYLGLELGIPIATGAMLERAKRAAVRLLTAEQAFRYKCVPLIVQDRQLIAAIDEPYDLDTLEALAQLTGYRVIPRVAAEVRIYYYIERYYGVTRPSRFRSLGDAPRGDQPPTSRLPAPPLPGLPPMSRKPVAAPAGAPVPVSGPRYGRAASRPPEEAYEDLRIEAGDMLEELAADDDASAEQAPVTAAPAAALPAAPAPAPAPAAVAWTPIDAAAAQQAMAAAPDRGAIADALIAYAARLFDVAVLFIVRDNLAFGWRSSGAGVDPARVECALIPLEAASIFQQAVAGDGRFHGAPTPSAILAHWYKVLRVAEPSHATVAAVSIRKRAVHLVYGHRVDRAPLTDDELAELTAVTQAAAEGYARLIAGAKAR